MCVLFCLFMLTVKCAQKVMAIVPAPREEVTAMSFPGKGEVVYALS